MFFFYAFEKLVRRATEAEIWNERYFDSGWQVFFDIPNSLPILGALAFIAWAVRRSGWTFFFVSMILHALADLPLHQSDAHRHFFPLSEWRFASPVSYWDPAGHGALFTLLEIFLVLAGILALFLRHRTRSARVALAVVGVSYFAYFGYVFLVWM